MSGRQGSGVGVIGFIAICLGVIMALHPKTTEDFIAGIAIAVGGLVFLCAGALGIVK